MRAFVILGIVAVTWGISSSSTAGSEGRPAAERALALAATLDAALEGCPFGRCTSHVCPLDWVKVLAGMPSDPEYAQEAFEGCVEGPCSEWECGNLLGDDLAELALQVENLSVTSLMQVVEKSSNIKLNMDRLSV